MQDDNLAQDIVQDAFLNFWKKRKKLTDEVNLKSYLFTSVRNKALEHIRRNKMMLDHEESIRINELLRHEIEDESEKYVRLEQIHKAILTLPEKCRQVFSLSKINGLSYAEISEHLGISVKTVENQVVRALQLLREKLNR